MDFHGKRKTHICSAVNRTQLRKCSSESIHLINHHKTYSFITSNTKICPAVTLPPPLKPIPEHHKQATSSFFIRSLFLLLSRYFIFSSLFFYVLCLRSWRVEGMVFRNFNKIFSIIFNPLMNINKKNSDEN